MKVIRGSCNQCGQCCGLDNNIPAFGWGFFEIILQTKDNPDFPFTALPEKQQYIWSWVNAALDKQRKVRIGGTNYDVIVITGVGLCKNSAVHSCPFLLSNGSCGVWNEPSVAEWHDGLCKVAYPYNGYQLKDSWAEDGFARFKLRHPSCSFVVEEE